MTRRLRRSVPGRSRSAYEASTATSRNNGASGLIIGFTWTSGQITAIARNGVTMVSGIGYRPFGEAKSWSYANGETTTRTFDLDGRMISDAVDSSIS